MSGKGHPLPASDEARHNEIPEGAEAEKGEGEDAEALVQPQDAVTPAGEPYRYDDLGRGPGGGGRRGLDKGEFAADQAAHQERGQSLAEAESEGQEEG